MNQIFPTKVLALSFAVLVLGFAPIQRRGQELKRIPDNQVLAAAPDHNQAVFELRDDEIVGKFVRNSSAAKKGLLCWERIRVLFPLSCRKLLVQFNVRGGRGLAGSFGGAGSNDTGRKGYQFSVAKYLMDEEPGLANSDRQVTRRRGTLDWTLVHELGHYICLRTWAIEHYSMKFDGDNVEQPERREDPDDYPEDGSPKLDGNFVTSYAERSGGDEEVVECFAAFMLIEELPTNDSLAARKIRFFETMPGFPEMRERIQSIGKKRR